MKRAFPRLAAVWVALGLVVPVFAAPAVPKWLSTASRGPDPAGAAAAPAAVLLDETVLEVRPDGRLSTTHRAVLRVLNRAGAEYANGSVFYLDKVGRVTTASAWLLRDGKELKLREKREWADMTVQSPGAIHDQTRQRRISYADVALPDDIFGYETVVDESMLFGQVQYRWDTNLPRVVERVRLALPEGWTYTAIITGPRAAELEASAARSGWWALASVPYRPPEPDVPDFATVHATLMLTLRPGNDFRGNPISSFSTWAEVRDWTMDNASGQCDSDALLVAKVAELTAGCADPLARVRALGRYVQRLRYVGLNRDLDLGMGYRPRKATEVNAKGWGDCKDKTNLLCALLREAGIEAFPVAARFDGRREVSPDWPSPRQFNHEITAIRVDDSVALPSVVEVPGVGRLLFFDPTHPDVAVGDLPWEIQGTLAQVLAPGCAADLTTLPVIDARVGHSVHRSVQLELAGSGVKATCAIAAVGRVGAYWQGMSRRMTKKDFNQELTRRLNESVRGAEVTAESVDTDHDSGLCRVSFHVEAPQFGQPLPGGQRLVRLDILRRDAVPNLAAQPRLMPLDLPPVLQQDEVELSLPAGWGVGELPKPVEVHSTFGDYESSCELVAGKVVARCTFRLAPVTIEPADYDRLRGFLADVTKAER